MNLMKNYELQLAQRVCSGDRDAFREIVEDNKKKIFYFAYDLTGSTQDAEDLSQDVFIKAFRSMDKFKGEASLGTWLYRITLNAYLDKRRKKSYQIEKQGETLEEHRAAEPIYDASPSTGNPERHAESKQIQVHIQQAMEHLSPRERSVFIMRHYQGLSGKSVGNILNISEGTVKSLLSRAMKKLQDKLGFYRQVLRQEVY